MNELLGPLIVGTILVAAPAWIMGWHFGAQSLRNRHKKLIRLLEENNKVAKERNLSQGNNWYSGFNSGVSTTLTAFEVFLEKFKE